MARLIVFHPQCKDLDLRMTNLNLASESYAHSLVAARKVDRSSAWSFDAADGNALLGKNGDDWENYSRHHLGLDRSANDKTKARYKFPLPRPTGFTARA
jgi:hypothetical protein